MSLNDPEMIAKALILGLLCLSIFGRRFLMSRLKAPAPSAKTKLLAKGKRRPPSGVY